MTKEIEIVIALVNGLCGVAVIVSLALHSDICRIPVFYRLVAWGGSAAMVFQSTCFLTGGMEDGLEGRALIYVVHWVVIFAALARAIPKSCRVDVREH